MPTKVQKIWRNKNKITKIFKVKNKQLQPIVKRSSSRHAEKSKFPHVNDVSTKRADVYWNIILSRQKNFVTKYFRDKYDINDFDAEFIGTAPSTNNRIHMLGSDHNGFNFNHKQYDPNYVEFRLKPGGKFNDLHGHLEDIIEYGQRLRQRSESGAGICNLLCCHILAFAMSCLKKYKIDVLADKSELALDIFNKGMIKIYYDIIDELKKFKYKTKPNPL